MAQNGGVIDIHDLMTEKALNISEYYLDNIQKMIQGNNKFLNSSVDSFKKVTSQIDDLNNKMLSATKHSDVNKLTGETNKILTESNRLRKQIASLQKLNIELDKKKYEAEMKLEKLKQARLRTSEKQAAINRKEEQEYEKKIKKQLDNEKRSIQEKERSILADRRLYKAIEKRFDTYEKGVKKQLDTQAKESNRYYQIQSSVLKLSQTYNHLATRKQLGEKLSTKEEAQLLSLESKLNKYNEALKKVDASIGKHNRSVGDYSSHWDGLGNSINQITRELPAFTFSMQTGFLALSNNIPILADEIQRVSANVKELRDKGNQVPGVMSRLLSSFLSWQTALSLGVTLITVYGKEIGDFVTSLFKTKEGFDELKESKLLLDAAMEVSSTSELVKSIIDLKQKIDLAKRGIVEKKKVLKQYNESIGKVIGKANNLNEAEALLVNNTEKVVKAVLFRAAANLAAEKAAKSLIEAERTRQKELEEFENKFLDASVSNIRTQQQYEMNQQQIETNRKKRREEAAKSFEEAAKKEEEIAKNFIEKANSAAEGLNFSELLWDDSETDGKSKTKKEDDRLNALKESYSNQMDLLIWRNNRESELYLEASQNEELSFNDRIDALNKAQELKTKATEESYKKELTLLLNFNKDSKALTDEEIQNYLDANISIGDLTDEQKLILEKWYAEKSELGKDYNTKLEEQFKKEAELMAQQAALKITTVDTNESADIEALNKQYTEDLRNFTGTEEEKVKLTQAFEAQKESIRNSYLRTKLKTEIENTEKLISLGKFEKSEQIRLLNELQQFKTQLSELELEEQQEFTDKKLEKEKEYNERLKELAIDFANSVGDLINAIFDNRIQRIDEDIERTNEKYEKEIQLAEGNENQQKRLRIKQQAEVEKLEAKKRKEQKKQAVYNKAMVAMEIGINTALAVTKSLPDFVMAAIVGALGAVQLATVLATPIPKYEYGTRGKPHKGGPARVGEKRPEVILEPGKEPYLVNHDMIVDLPKGTEVIPSMDEYKKLQKTAMLMSLNNEKQKLDSYQTNVMFDSIYGAQVVSKLDELVKQKKSTTVNVSPKIDIGHEIWRMKNLNW